MKKLLSLLLALTLIISVAPMSFANDVTETTDEPGMYFNFNAAAFDSNEIITAAKIKENGDAAEPVYASVNTDPWYIDGQSQLTDFCLSGATADTATYTNSRANALWWKIAKGVRGTRNSGFVIKLKINETGVFTPTISFRSTSSSNAWRFFLGPVALKDKDGQYTFETDDTIIKNIPISVAFSDSTRDSRLLDLGKLDFYAKSAKNNTYTGGNITINKTGEYYLYVVANGVGSSNLPGTKIDPLCMNIYSFNLTPVPAQELAEEALTPSVDDSEPVVETASVMTAAYYGGKSTEFVALDGVTYGESVTVPAAEKTVIGEDNKTYNFSYWALGLNTGVGNKHILSTDLSFDYKPSAGTNYLIAVYEEEGNAEEAFYDRNGQLLTGISIGNDGLLPALPAMAGLGNAIGWEQLGTGKVFAADFDVSELEGDKVFMAKYNEPGKNITINGKDFAYGDTVTCNSLADTGYVADTFSYWTRTIGSGKEEIVSIDPDYSFSAYTACTIKAECKGKVELANPRKIALSTFKVNDNLTAVMAEFIGFTAGVKEKGIMFGGQKIAMTTDKAQFTVTNDTADSVTVTGYAIVDEDGATVKYTDGSISVPGATAE